MLIDGITNRKMLANIAKTGKGDANRNIRLTAVSQLTGQTELADIAKNAEDNIVRHAAVVKITDRKTLSDVAENADDSGIRETATMMLSVDNITVVQKNIRLAGINQITEITKRRRRAAARGKSENDRVAAVQRITDQNILAGIVKSAEHGHVRITAAKKITGQTILFNIVQTKDFFNNRDVCTNVAIRRIAVANITDQTLLVDIINDDSSDVAIRKIALSKLTDHTVPAGITESAEVKKVNIEQINNRIAEVEQITDQETLAGIAKNDKYEIVGIVAVKKITDPKLLVDIIKKKHGCRISKLAVANITDQALLVDIINNSPKDAGFFKMAFEQITDPAAFIAIAKQCKNSTIRKMAVKKLAGNAGYVCDINSTKTSAKKSKTELTDIRIAEIEQITDQETLIDIAKKDKNERIRIAAIKKITGQALLVDIINDSSNSVAVVRAAISVLTDQTALAEIVKNKSDSCSRIDALAKITGQAAFADIVVNSDNNIIRMKAFEEITGQAAFATVAKQCKKANLRMAAFAKITEQAAFADVAKNGSDNTVRKMAVHKLTDQATLVDIVQNDANYWVRCAAFEHVTGQAAFADIAKNEKNYKPIRIAAIKKLDDRTILAGIAKNTADKDVCRAALNGFTDTEALIDVAENAVNWQIRADIYERLGYKQNALSVIAKHAASPSVRKAAVDDLTDQTLLVDIAKNADNWYARAAAVEKLTDRTALADIAENDGDWHVRVTAYTKLDDEQNVACLALIAKNHWNVYTRQEALKDIADMETLKDIAEKYIADINAANGEYNADISQKTEMVNAISQQFPELF